MQLERVFIMKTVRTIKVGYTTLALPEGMTQVVVSKELLERVINYLQGEEERHYEETIDLYGVGSDEANNHIYNICRNLWCEMGP